MTQFYNDASIGRTAEAPVAAASAFPLPQSETATKRLALVWRVAGGAGTGLLLAACFPPLSQPWLLPLAVAALLGLLSGVTVRPAFYIGLSFGFALFASALFWLTNLFGVSAISLWAILAAFPALFAALFVWLRGRLPRVPIWLLAAVVWTGVEYYRSEPFVLNFGWLGLGYAVVNAPALAVCASWFGSYGLSFALVAFSALLLRLAIHPGKRPLAGGLILLWLLILWIPRPVPPPSRPMQVRLVQANSEDDAHLWGLSHPTPGARADVIVWPEYSLVSDPRRIPLYWQKLEGVARENRAYFLFGAKEELDPRDDTRFRNTAFLLDPSGRLIGKHTKNHTVHFIRDGVGGTQARALPTALGKLGIAICFDMDFPDVARRLAADGAEVFLAPSDDPPEWGPIQPEQHRLLFQMRAAECGRWLARADVAGGTSVVAPTGREILRVSTRSPAVLEARLGRETVQTLYVRGGWRFGPACLWALLVLCAWAALPVRWRGFRGS